MEKSAGLKYLLPVPTCSNGDLSEQLYFRRTSDWESDKKMRTSHKTTKVLSTDIRSHNIHFPNPLIDTKYFLLIKLWGFVFFLLLSQKMRTTLSRQWLTEHHGDNPAIPKDSLDRCIIRLESSDYYSEYDIVGGVWQLNTATTKFEYEEEEETQN